MNWLGYLKLFRQNALIPVLRRSVNWQLKPEIQHLGLNVWNRSECDFSASVILVGRLKIFMLMFCASTFEI